MKATISRICQVYPGAAFRARVPERSLPGKGVAVIQAKDIEAEGTIDPSGVITIDAADEPTNATRLHVGDVLFQPRGRTYKAGVVESLPEDAIAASPIYTLRIAGDHVDPAWLALTLNSPAAQSALQASARGTFIPQVPRDAVEQLQIEIPDLATQRALTSLTKLAQRERALAERIFETRIALISALAHRSSNSQRRSRAPGKMPV